MMLANSGWTWPKYYNEVPKEVFVRDDVYAAEVERFFHGAEWHPIAHVSEVANPGDFKTLNLVQVPLLITRGKDGEVRVFYNSCTHRATQVETARQGNRSRFQCPYHRWTFDGEGKLVGCPNKQEFSPGFDTKDYGLQQPRFEIFHGLIFVTLSAETESLEEFLGNTMAPLAESMGGERPIKLIGYQKVRYQCNWKALNDNDGYHPPLLHTAFRLLNWQGGKGQCFSETRRGHRVTDAQVGGVRNKEFLRDPSLIETPGSEDAIRTLAVVLFPTFSSVRHFGNVNIRFVNPLGVNEVEVQYTYFAYADDSEETERHRIRQCSNLLGPSGMVSLEDASMFNRIQIGSHTPGQAIFQKGVRDVNALPTKFPQNEETANLITWEYYRNALGMVREV